MMLPIHRSNQQRGMLMKRDMETIRDILLEIEKTGDCEVLRFVPNREAKFLGLETNDLSPEEEAEESTAHYHRKYNYDLLVREGWISESMPGMMIAGLSMQAHDFLDTTREASRWMKLKNAVGIDKLQSMPVDTVKAIAVRLFTEAATSNL